MCPFDYRGKLVKTEVGGSELDKTTHTCTPIHTHTQSSLESRSDYAASAQKSGRNRRMLRVERNRETPQGPTGCGQHRDPYFGTDRVGAEIAGEGSGASFMHGAGRGLN